jgi:hypothetical protein
MRQSGSDNATVVFKSMPQTGRKRHHAMQFGMLMAMAFLISTVAAARSRGWEPD